LVTDRFANAWVKTGGNNLQLDVSYPLVSREIEMAKVPAVAPADCHAQLNAALDDALEEFAKKPAISDEGVHAARKALKRARAGLRLLRNVLDDALYRSKNATLRDTGRQISAMRDSRSLIIAFDSMRDVVPRLRQVRFRKIRSTLLAKHNHAREEFARKAEEQQRAIELLAECSAEIRKWILPSNDPDAIGNGLQKIYKRGLKSYKFARDLVTAEAIHEWRKQVKYLANALGMMAKGGNKKDIKYKKDLDKLADKLGDDHDLVMLARELAGPSPIDAALRVELISLVTQRRSTLKARAFAMGKDLYDLKPKQWTARYVAQGESGQPVRNQQGLPASAHP